MIIDVSPEELDGASLVRVVAARLAVQACAPRTWADLRLPAQERARIPHELHIVGWSALVEHRPEDAAGLLDLVEAVRETRPGSVATFGDDLSGVTVRIDLSGVADADGLHRLLKRELGFPAFYGRNWNAFWDAVTGLVETPGALHFTGWPDFTARLPEDAETLRSLLTDLADFHRTAGGEPRPLVTYA
ncbi:barstar family protein [Nocardiopsis potens]|uniref:barstar family protein n=1 Tax=Nocardiopsis potens TaxID=1246458 RepID=UPI00034AD424|nr:barstar family protein [Nocardiopsis potens]